MFRSLKLHRTLGMFVATFRAAELKSEYSLLTLSPLDDANQLYSGPPERYIGVQCG